MPNKMCTVRMSFSARSVRRFDFLTATFSFFVDTIQLSGNAKKGSFIPYSHLFKGKPAVSSENGVQCQSGQHGLVARAMSIEGDEVLHMKLGPDTSHLIPPACLPARYENSHDLMTQSRHEGC